MSDSDEDFASADEGEIEAKPTGECLLIFVHT